MYLNFVFCVRIFAKWTAFSKLTVSNNSGRSVCIDAKSSIIIFLNHDYSTKILLLCRIILNIDLTKKP